jgi:hypothetical protein
MSKLEDALEFRSSTKPLLTMWSVGEAQALGSLLWSSGRPILTLFLETAEELGRDFANANIPILQLTKPPTQATITGRVSKYGTVTLERCARYNIRTTHITAAGRYLYELGFLPTAIWIGAPTDAVDNNVTNVVAWDSRLAGFFGSPGLRVLGRFDAGDKAIFEVLHQPKGVWAVHGPDQHQIAIGETGWLLSVYTTASETWSSTKGHTLQSWVCLALHAPEKTSIAEAGRLIAKLEEIFSVFAIEPFTIEVEEYNADEFASITLVWRLGDDRSLFRPPMRHQILIDLSNVETLKTICRQWFAAPETVSLSRWLFVRALRETQDGLARFVAVAQAFEVLGREFGPHESMSKCRLSQAIALVREALSRDFDRGFVERIVSLIQSSNRSSFRDVLSHMLGEVVKGLRIDAGDDLAEFSKSVADTRNAVVHMTDRDKGKLNDAFARVNKLSLQLCFWYSVCQAHYLGVEIPNLQSFLFNNRNARHGLPNELLARDG